MPQAPQTILTTSSEPLPSLSSISLLPCSLAFDGPAPISTYFHPRPYVPESTTPDLEEKQQPHRQAAFRGRRLISTTFSLPQGYKGLVFSTKAAVPPRATEDEMMEQELETMREEKNRKAREERAAKRAKTSIEGGDSSMRRSPRKAAQAARERAIKAAKEKAKGKGKGANKFSLDDSDEEEEEEEKEAEQPEPTKVEEVEGEKTEAEESQEQAQPEETKMQIEETISSTITITDGVLPTNEPSIVEETTFTSEEEATLVIEATSTLAEPSLVQAPLLTRTSTSLSTHLHLPTTPSATIVSEPSFSSLPPPPIELAKDEKHLNPVSIFQKIEIWNPDFMIPGGRVEEEDQVARSVKEWIGLANKIHAY
ncbi:hypothetical protein JCM5350_004431 [Sporobolomyces pararoseus]